MIAKLFEILSAWILLSLIVGLLVSTAFREVPSPGYAPSLETPDTLNELEGEEMLVPAP